MEKEIEEKPGRFIAIMHRWFIGSDGFRIVELSCNTWEEAHKEAALIHVQHDSIFKHAAVTLVEIGLDEHLIRPRVKLKKGYWGNLIQALLGIN